MPAVATAVVVLIAIASGVLGARVLPPPDDSAVAAAVSWQPPARAVERARASHLEALFRARAERSADGVLHACEGFARLGDRDVVRACLRVAHDLTDPGDARAGDRLRALATWLADRERAQRPRREER